MNQKNRWYLMISVIALSLASISYRKYQFREVAIPAENSLKAALAQPEKFDPCFKKDRCLTIYVAPWCSICKAQLPEYVALASRLQNSKIGVRYLVGDSTDARNLSTAELWKSGNYAGKVDDAQYAVQNKIEIFPAFLIHDFSGKITATGKEAWQQAQSWKPN